MPATFSIPLQQVIPGQLIASALWNSEFGNIYSGLTPGGMDDYSQTNGQMQTQTDPYPLSVITLATSQAGELERLRYVLAGIKGTTYWYEVPVKTIAALNTLVLGHTHTGTTDGTQVPTGGIADAAVTYAKLAAAERFAPGTTLPFYQASAPVGWTQVVSQNDKALRVVSGSGGVAGGTTLLSAGISITLAAHTHTTPDTSHSHTLNTVGTEGSVNTLTASAFRVGVDSINGDNTVMIAPQAGGGSTLNRKSATTNSQGGAGVTGSNGAAASTVTLAYVDVILCQKN